MSGLEKRLGYTFRNKDLLTLALQHSSYANELKSKGMKQPCNERLEFFGDSVLSLIVSDYLYFRYSENAEGDLTKIRAAVVCERALAKYAAEISLGDYLLLGCVLLSVGDVLADASRKEVNVLRYHSYILTK